MSKHFYLSKFSRLLREICFLLQKSIEFQVFPSIIEQIENLHENCTALIEETKTLPNERKRWPLFEESYEDLKLDYFFVVNMLKDMNFK